MAKLADALDLGSSAARHVGSSPSIRTTLSYTHITTQEAIYKHANLLQKTYKFPLLN